MANACILQIQALLWIAWELSAETTQNTIQNWHYSSKRSRDLHMHQQKPRPGHIPDWKTNKLQNMSRNIYDLSSFYLF